MKTLESPLVSYLVIGFFSPLAAGIMFLIGGSLATVSNQQGNFLRFGFEAGGAFAGFVIVFWLSLRIVERLKSGRAVSPPLTHHSSIFTQGQSYVCKYWLRTPER